MGDYNKSRNGEGPVRKVYRSDILHKADSLELGYINSTIDHVRIKLPEGCIGLQLVFKNKKYARLLYGDKKTPLTEVLVTDDGKTNKEK